METTKAKARREREGFFCRYLRGDGIDVGCGADPATQECRRFDRALGDGDATLLAGIPAGTLDWLYSSHCLEHLGDPITALRNWWRVLKPRGVLIVVVPHRDLYEKRTTLPSRWNGEHRFFVLPDRDEPPCTFSLLGLLHAATGGLHELLSLRVLDDGHTITDPARHSDGEYSIEIIARKPPGVAHGL